MAAYSGTPSTCRATGQINYWGIALVSEIAWGSVPEWAGSLLTGSSLLIAALAYRRSVRDKETDQASKTVAWISMAAETTGSEDEKHLKTHVFVRNSSKLPIRQATAWISFPDGKTLGREHWDTILPEMTVRRPNNEYDWDDQPALQFLDAAGRWWHRDEKGHLNQGKSSNCPPPPMQDKFYMGPDLRDYR